MDSQPTAEGVTRDELERRLAALEAKTVHTPVSRKIPLRWVILLALFPLLVAALFYVHTQNSGIKHDLRGVHANFALYAPPRGTARGYKYVSTSLLRQGGIVTYKLRNNTRSVTVTEQALPSPPPNIDAISGYSKTTLPLGSGIIGGAGNHPTAIILTDKTLLNFTSTPGVTVPVLTGIVSSFEKLNP